MPTASLHSAVHAGVPTGRTLNADGMVRIHAPRRGPLISQWQFEAMRESTKRIAAGEDPDEVNQTMGAPPGSNRAARRAAKKKIASGKKKKKKM